MSLAPSARRGRWSLPCLLLVASLASAHAADICFKDTGFTTTRHLAWNLPNDGIRVTHFKVQRRLVFPNAAMPGWVDDSQLYFQDVCITKPKGRSCYAEARDNGSIYQTKPCNDLGCSPSFVPIDDYMPCCHVEGGAICYAGLAVPPGDCQ